MAIAPAQSHPGAACVESRRVVVRCSSQKAGKCTHPSVVRYLLRFEFVSLECRLAQPCFPHILASIAYQTATIVWYRGVFPLSWAGAVAAGMRVKPWRVTSAALLPHPNHFDPLNTAPPRVRDKARSSGIESIKAGGPPLKELASFVSCSQLFRYALGPARNNPARY